MRIWRLIVIVGVDLLMCRILKGIGVNALPVSVIAMVSAS